MKIKEIYDYLDSIAPFETALSFDNAGLIVGNLNEEIRSVFLALDITNEVIKEAASVGANLIISHHPVIFDPLKKLDMLNPVYLLAQNGMAAICAHTNLDAAENGVNTVLAKKIGLENLQKWDIGLIGESSIKNIREFALYVKEKLFSEKVSVVDSKKDVKRVAVMSGAGGGDIQSALQACADTLVTGEMKYSQFIEAKNYGLNVIAAGHFETENIIIPFLNSEIKERFPMLECFSNTKKPLFDI